RLLLRCHLNAAGEIRHREHVQRIDEEELILAPNFPRLLVLHQGLIGGSVQLRKTTDLSISRARRHPDHPPCVLGRNDKLVGVGFVYLGLLPVRAPRLVGDDREGIGHWPAAGAVAQASFLLATSRGGGRLGPLAELLGNGPYAIIVGSFERRACHQRQHRGGRWPAPLKPRLLHELPLSSRGGS